MKRRLRILVAASLVAVAGLAAAVLALWPHVTRRQLTSSPSGLTLVRTKNLFGERCALVDGSTRLPHDCGVDLFGPLAQIRALFVRIQRCEVTAIQLQLLVRFDVASPAQRDASLIAIEREGPVRQLPILWLLALHLCSEEGPWISQRDALGHLVWLHAVSDKRPASQALWVKAHQLLEHVKVPLGVVGLR